MIPSHLEYATIVVASWIVPFLYLALHSEFRKKSGLRLFQPSIFIAALPFIGWDLLAVERGHWSFNPHYLSGISFLGLPLEEYLFFFLIPQACLLIWGILNVYPTKRELIDAITHHFKSQS
ncbi:lycopene cyclase domain-containing protein [Candidatus Woesebacteria bacterium]|nr:lycopene cyclase domain-containing protein [Candidatus Woesebacteria bacterium]